MTSTELIRPFRIEIPQPDIDDLHDRLARTRWFDDLPGVGWIRGVPTSYLQGLADYWRGQFDWRSWEARLNALPHFVTEIEGQPIHFVHVRSPEPDALPLVLTHGWPSSFVEFLDLIGPLTDPRSHGGDPSDAFHVVIPSLPGFGFSTPLRETGWGNLFRVAGAWAELMSRLGYERFAAQGGDVGAGVTGMLAMIAPHRLVGAHTNGPTPGYPFGPPIDIDGLDGTDRVRAERFNEYQRDGLGYLHLQATRPHTLAHLITDSPVGQLAWIVEKFKEWTDESSDLPEDAVDRDQLLANASIYWFSRSGASSAHITYEGMQAFRQFMEQHAANEGGDGASTPTTELGVPTGVAVFAADMSVRSLIDPARSLAHWAEYDRGGHFPAMEVPDLLVQDVRTFFGQLRR
ncbi:MAG TPA: epoxide hydrolase [Jiangellaceae bacterium]|nr:epoxide hydrolase [Jiangellaceae bacterium]